MRPDPLAKRASASMLQDCVSRTAVAGVLRAGARVRAAIHRRKFRACLGDFDPCFTAQTIDAETDLAPDLAGVGSPDIEPVIEMEI